MSTQANSNLDYSENCLTGGQSCDLEAELRSDGVTVNNQAVPPGENG